MMLPGLSGGPTADRCRRSHSQRRCGR